MNPPGAGAGPAPAQAPVFGALDHPRQIPAFAVFAGTCCYHQMPVWRPAQVLPACRLCLRPVLQPMLCPIRAAASVSNSRLSRLDWHRASQQHPAAPHICARPALPSEALSRSCFSLSQSPPRRRQTLSASEQLGQRSPGSQRAHFAAAAPPTTPVKPPPHPARWIGEETKRSLPRHVYKYYLAQTREYRRQHIQVNVAKTAMIFSMKPKILFFCMMNLNLWTLIGSKFSN